MNEASWLSTGVTVCGAITGFTSTGPEYRLHSRASIIVCSAFLTMLGLLKKEDEKKEQELV